MDRACFLLIRDSFFFQLITSAIYLKPIPTCISFELLHQLFIPLTFSKKEGNGLSISEFDIESIASPTTRSSTKNCIGDLLDLFQWDHSPTETQSDMDIEDSTVNMVGSKEGTTTTPRDCPSPQEKENSEKEQEN